MPGMFNVMARTYPDLSDQEQLYSVNAGVVICTHVFGPRMCYPKDKPEGMYYSVRIVVYDIILYVGQFRTLEEAEEKHQELIKIIDLALRRVSL